MVRASTSKKQQRGDGYDAEAAQNPDALTRKRLKKLAISNGVLSETPARSRSVLNPTKTVLKHHGTDILKKSQRKNRYLFSFPGLVGPLGGGKIGELKDLGTKNPILYLDFPQGQMKLFGTIVYPKNRYLTLQFSRGGKNVMCEDYFDNMIVFSDAWWIGRKEENPEEARLDFPKELTEAHHVECNFQGGAGAEVATSQVKQKKETKYAAQSPKTDTEDDGKPDLKELKEQTPTRHSERTAGRTFKFTEDYSGDDSINSDEDVNEVEDDNSDEAKEKVRSKIASRRVLDIDNKGKAAGHMSSGKIQPSATSDAKSKQLSEVAVSSSQAKQDGHSNHGSLVQSTISTLFKKVEQKNKVEESIPTRSSRKSSSAKDSDKNLKKMDLKRKVDEDQFSRKKAKLGDAEKSSGRTGTTSKKKVQEVEEDDIEECPSSSEDIDSSDEDWET